MLNYHAYKMDELEHLYANLHRYADIRKVPSDYAPSDTSKYTNGRDFEKELNGLFELEYGIENQKNLGIYYKDKKDQEACANDIDLFVDLTTPVLKFSKNFIITPMFGTPIGRLIFPNPDGKEMDIMGPSVYEYKNTLVMHPDQYEQLKNQLSLIYKRNEKNLTNSNYELREFIETQSDFPFVLDQLDSVHLTSHCWKEMIDEIEHNASTRYVKNAFDKVYTAINIARGIKRTIFNKKIYEKKNRKTINSCVLFFNGLDSNTLKCILQSYVQNYPDNNLLSSNPFYVVYVNRDRLPTPKAELHRMEIGNANESYEQGVERLNNVYNRNIETINQMDTNTRSKLNNLIREAKEKLEELKLTRPILTEEEIEECDEEIKLINEEIDHLQKMITNSSEEKNHLIQGEKIKLKSRKDDLFYLKSKGQLASKTKNQQVSSKPSKSSGNSKSNTKSSKKNK